MSAMNVPFTITSIGTTSPAPVRPAAFHEQYIAIRPIPYRFIESSQRVSSSGGVLRRGQAIWLEQTLLRTSLTSSVQAFVEDVGHVSLDGRLIKKGDGSILPH